VLVCSATRRRNVSSETPPFIRRMNRCNGQLSSRRRQGAEVSVDWMTCSISVRPSPARLADEAEQLLHPARGEIVFERVMEVQIDEPCGAAVGWAGFVGRRPGPGYRHVAGRNCIARRTPEMSGRRRPGGPTPCQDSCSRPRRAHRPCRCGAAVDHAWASVRDRTHQRLGPPFGEADSRPSRRCRASLSLRLAGRAERRVRLLLRLGSEAVHGFDEGAEGRAAVVGREERGLPACCIG
jgi:hypothetical protein